ncbi:MAG TPA: PGPGW domain-containing protein [Polyangia bacterium]|nr:PGPGW domain-containing protein [Polyangia bacterium]
MNKAVLELLGEAVIEMIVRRNMSGQLRRIAIAIAGVGVLALGLALVVVPIPGTTIVVIPLGLAILAKEFAWAERLLATSTQTLRRGWAGVRRAFGGSPTALTPAPGL